MSIAGIAHEISQMGVLELMLLSCGVFVVMSLVLGCLGAGDDF